MVLDALHELVVVGAIASDDQVRLAVENAYFRLIAEDVAFLRDHPGHWLGERRRAFYRCKRNHELVLSD